MCGAAVAVRPSLSDVVGLTYTTAAEPIRTLATRPPCAYACRWPDGQSVTIVGQYMRVRLRDKRTFGVMNVALEEKLVASYTCFFGQTLFLNEFIDDRPRYKWYYPHSFMPTSHHVTGFASFSISRSPEMHEVGHA